MRAIAWLPPVLLLALLLPSPVSAVTSPTSYWEDLPPVSAMDKKHAYWTWPYNYGIEASVTLYAKMHYIAVPEDGGWATVLYCELHADAPHHAYAWRQHSAASGPYWSYDFRNPWVNNFGNAPPAQEQRSWGGGKVRLEPETSTALAASSTANWPQGHLWAAADVSATYHCPSKIQQSWIPG